MTQTNSGLKAFTAGAAVTRYRRAKLDSSGNAVHADADDDSIGTFEETAASGDHVTVKLRNCPGTRKVIAAGAVAAYALVKAADSGKVDDATTGGRSEYVALEAASADGDAFEALPMIQPAGGLLSSNVADSTTITNTIVETAFDVSKTIDGGILKIGDILDVEALVNVPTTNGTDTLNLRLKVGTEEIVATGGVDVANNDIGYIRASVKVRAIGAAGSLSGTGVQALGAPGTVTAKPFRKAAAAEDLSGDVAITVTAQWSVANAGNTCDLEELNVTLRRQ